MLGFLLTFIVALVVGLPLLVRRVLTKNPKIEAPFSSLPSPPSLPVVGHAFSLPAKHTWLLFHSWSKTHGPLFRLNIFGQQHLIISSERIANDLLRDRGTIYSSRPWLPAADSLMSDGLRPLFWSYGQDIRRARAFWHRILQSAAAKTYEDTQAKESLQALRDLIRDPDKYEICFTQYSGGVISRLGFAKKPVRNDPTIKRAIAVVHNVERVASPGAYLVDSFPWLLHLPDWMAPFKRELKQLHAEELDLFRGLLADSEARLAEDEAVDCWQKIFIRTPGNYKLTEDQGAYVVGVLFEAGARTTAAALMSFMLSLLLHAAELAKLQAELDEVVGIGRLPQFSDMPQLPRLRAVVKEVMRWRPVTAGGIPHLCTKDNTYAIGKQTHMIRAGTIIHANQWAIHRDPTLYPDPEAFRPERWIESQWPTYREPLEVYPNLQQYSAFGFGRRICPGSQVAERSLNIMAARIAWACTWSRKVTADGSEVPVPEYDYVEGFNVQPKWFPFDLKVRSAERLELLKQAQE